MVINSVSETVVWSEVLPSTRVDFDVPGHSGVNQIRASADSIFGGEKVAICGYAILVDETNAHCCSATQLIATPDKLNVIVTVGGPPEVVTVAIVDTTSMNLGGPLAGLCGFNYLLGTQ